MTQTAPPAVHSLRASVRTIARTVPPRRRRWWRAATATGALVALPFLPVPTDDDDEARESAESPDDSASSPGITAFARSVVHLDDESGSATPTPEPPAPAEEREAIATYGALEIGRMSTETQLIGFHEAYFGNAVAVQPAGPLVANHNPAKSDLAAEPAAPVIPASMVLPPRDRPTDAHSAIDVAIPEGAAVRAPVDGTVINVLRYTLYGKHPDTRIEIVPDDAPGTILVMLHVTDAQVVPGDTVTAGETVVADSPTSFPFESQIDRFATQHVGQSHPHVHLELKPAV